MAVSEPLTIDCCPWCSRTSEGVASFSTHLAVIEVRVALAVEDHGVVAHDKEVATHVVQRRESARHDSLSDERQIHRLLDHLEHRRQGGYKRGEVQKTNVTYLVPKNMPRRGTTTVVVVAERMDIKNRREALMVTAIVLYTLKADTILEET